VDLPAPTNEVAAGQEVLATLFAEELGLVLEVRLAFALYFYFALVLLFSLCSALRCVHAHACNSH